MLELVAHHGLDELVDLGRGVVAEVVEQRRPDRAHADVVLPGLLLEHPAVRRQRKRPARDGASMRGLLAGLLLVCATREADANVLERAPDGPDERGAQLGGGGGRPRLSPPLLGLALLAVVADLLIFLSMRPPLCYELDTMVKRQPSGTFHTSFIPAGRRQRG